MEHIKKIIEEEIVEEDKKGSGDKKDGALNVNQIVYF